MIWAKRDNLMRGASGWGDDKSQIAVFYPEQIKSAVGNRGTFSALSANILLEQALPREVAFNNWFGDSKVVDQDGKPLVVYHGSPNGEFTEFDTWPMFFTDNAEAARGYAEGRYARVDNDTAQPVVVDAFLSLQNPASTPKLSCMSFFRVMTAPSSGVTSITSRTNSKMKGMTV